MNYYVYVYLREDGSPYYIGKGKDKRAWKSHKRINGTELLPKDKTRIVILCENLLEHQAFDIEKELIAKYGRADNETGILRNVSDGGGFGSNGYKHDDETIEIIRLAAEINARKRVDEGSHNFQTQIHPNLGGKISKILIENGKHNLLKRLDGTSVASDRIENGTHHFLDTEWKKKHATEHSKWMIEQVENGDALFVKNNPAHTKVSCIHCKKETNLMGLSRFHKHTKENK